MMAPFEDRSEFYNEIIKAEGGGWGTNQNPSLSTLSSSQMTADSVSMSIGGAKTFYHKKLRNKDNLKLHDEARELLIKDPHKFAKEYGTFYLSEIGYGSSYLDLINVQSKTGDLETLKHFSDLNIKSLFTKQGSENYGQLLQKYGHDVMVDIVHHVQ